MIDTPQRCHQQIRYLDATVRLRGYEGPLRQRAVTGWGRVKATLLLSNHFEETSRQLILRYVGRNRIEDGLGIRVNFFHLDGLTREVRLKVDVDAAWTVLVHGCYRWLGSRLRGDEKAAPQQLCRRFVETGGRIEVSAAGLTVHVDKRRPNPMVREAALDCDCPRIRWIGNLPIAFCCP